MVVALSTTCYMCVVVQVNTIIGKNSDVLVGISMYDFYKWAHFTNLISIKKECLPYFKKLESFELGESEVRGGSGPVHSEVLKDVVDATNHWIDSCVKSGIEYNPDYNGKKSTGNFIDIPKSIFY